MVPAREALAAGVGDAARSTIGIRVPDHPVALALLTSTGPLAVTSANPAGGADRLDHEAAEAQFGVDVDGYLEGVASKGSGSTVVDMTVRPPVVLREGPLKLRFG